MEILIGLALAVWIVVTLVPFIRNERALRAERHMLAGTTREPGVWFARSLMALMAITILGSAVAGFASR
jgi:hypothetical protein